MKDTHITVSSQTLHGIYRYYLSMAHTVTVIRDGGRRTLANQSQGNRTHQSVSDSNSLIKPTTDYHMANHDVNYDVN